MAAGYGEAPATARPFDASRIRETSNLAKPQGVENMIRFPYVFKGSVQGTAIPDTGSDPVFESEFPSRKRPDPYNLLEITRLVKKIAKSHASAGRTRNRNGVYRLFAGCRPEIPVPFK
jgi:hypothetical protein